MTIVGIIFVDFAEGRLTKSIALSWRPRETGANWAIMGKSQNRPACVLVASSHTLGIVALTLRNFEESRRKCSSPGQGHSVLA